MRSNLRIATLGLEAFRCQDSLGPGRRERQPDHLPARSRAAQLWP